MRDLLITAEKLQETEKAIVLAQLNVVSNPQSDVQHWSLNSLVKIRRQLEEDFHKTASDLHQDIFRYRLFSESDEKLSADAAASSMAEFQVLFTALYAAAQSGPRSDFEPGSDAKLASRLETCYILGDFHGVVLTTNPQNDHFDKNLIDQTARSLFAVAKAKSAASIRAVKSELGPATIWQYLRWANFHVINKIGAEISWRRGDSADMILLDLPEMRRIERCLTRAVETGFESRFQRESYKPSRQSRWSSR